MKRALTRVVPGRILAAAIFAVSTTLLTACGPQAAASGPQSSGPEATAAAVEASQARERRIELAEEVVRNGRYELPGVGTFQLKDGSYQEKYGDGATQVRRVGVVTANFGDLDGDRVDDAAVVLWANTGGSGTFVYLVPVLNNDGQEGKAGTERANAKVQQAGAVLLGDRVQIRSLAVSSGKITVDVLAQGAGDAMVNPSLQSVQEYALRDGVLVNLTPATPTAAASRPTALPKAEPTPTAAPEARPTPRPTAQSTRTAAAPTAKPAEQPASQPPQPVASGLTGTIWTWQRFVDNGEKGTFAVPYPNAYRLELLADGQFLVQADCNSGRGAYTLEGSRLTLSLGPLTLAECQPGSRARQFVEKLGQVSSFVLQGDALSLNLAMDGGDLVFGRLNSVTGTIVVPAGESIPADGKLEAMVVDSAGARIGGSLVKLPPSMQFEAPFKPANINLSGAYTLEVTIKDAQDRVIFRNSRAYPVLTQGNPTYHLTVEVERVR